MNETDTVKRTFSGIDPFGDVVTQHQPTFFDQPEANRLDTYFEEIKPKLTKKEFEVTKAISEMGKEKVTMHEVAKHMKVELNTISGRFSTKTGLVAKGILKIVGRTTNHRSQYKLAEVNSGN